MTSTSNHVSQAQQSGSSLSSWSRKRVGLRVGICRKCGGQGHAKKENGRVLKKGPWTAEEDALLIDYVKNHGKRHWNCVKKIGLMRCGKSCRLRWTNHFQPDLKKGSFTIEEERVVLDLQAKLGNKWSKIAAQLPGRTDNEVKNFWNTKIKRRMKANLLSTNSDRNLVQRFSTLDQVQPMKNQNPRYPQQICSSSDSMNTSHYSPFPFNTSNFIPMSLQQNDLRKTNFNMINFSRTNDPILSFLNNPAYKFEFASEATNCNVNNFSLPSYPNPLYDLSTNSGNVMTHDFPSSSQLNSISLDATSCLASTCDKIEVPPNQIHNPHLFIAPTSKMLSISYGLDDIWISTSLGKNIEMEKSSVTQEGKCELNDFVDDDGEQILTILDGQGIRHMEELDYPSHGLSQNEVINLKKEESDELICLDDDLSSLMYDFSTNCSPPPSYHSSGFISEFINYKQIADSSFTLTSLPPAITIQEFDCDFNNNDCNHNITH